MDRTSSAVEQCIVFTITITTATTTTTTTTTTTIVIATAATTGGGGGSEHVGSSGDISEMYSGGVKIPGEIPATLCRVLYAILSCSRMQ